MNLLPKPVRLFTLAVQSVILAAYLLAIMGVVLFFGGAFNLF